MTDISSIRPLGPTAAPEPKVLKEGEDHNDLGTDTFLKLLVAQLKYQDPTNPSDSTQFLAQTAQFTMVEKITQLAEQAKKSSVADNNLAAASLVGRSVKYMATDGAIEEGEVTSARLGSEGPVLMVGGWEVDFANVYEVTTPPAVASRVPAPPAPATTTTPAPAPAAPPPAAMSTTTTLAAPVDEHVAVVPEDIVVVPEESRRPLDVDAS